MRVLVDGGNSGSGGYLHYLSGILGAGVPADAEVLLLCSPAIAAAVRPSSPQVRILAEPGLAAPSRHARLAWWHGGYPRVGRAFRPDVVLHPSGLVRGDSAGVPTVTIHHDMSPFTPAVYRHYGPSRQSARFALRWLRLARSFRRADGVIFHARYTREVVRRQVRGIRRTAVVPNAVPAAFLDAPARSYAPLRRPVSVLCVSTLYLFKHQPNVVDAVADLRARSGTDVRVDFVGGGEPRARARLLDRIDRRDAQGWARVVEDVAPHDMPRRYRDAELFVFPSAAETWPITLLEAMASGLPIACADRMAMPALLGDAGEYFDPENADSIRVALQRLLDDAALREAHGTRAREYAGAYRWERSAAAVFAFLREVAREAR
jgi:glycosyltransferase involved in cell wall biosynthesis